MQEHEVKTIVAEVLAEQKRLHDSEADEVVLRTISTILTSFGIEEEDRAELRADFQHLRRFRKSYEQVERVGWTAAITMMVTAFGTGPWQGIKASLGK